MHRLVSVVIPTKDRRERLARTLTTVQAQTYEPLEIVVADDGSTDGTAEFVAKFNDDRYVLAGSHHSTGVAAARNRGIRAASGHWIAVCDDDDLWHPDKVMRQVAALESSSAAWSFCLDVHVTDRLDVLGATGPVDTQDLDAQLAWANVVPGGCSSVVVERCLIEDIGGFDERLRVYADWDLWLRLVQHGAPAVWNGWGVLYVQHGGQMKRRLPETLDELRSVKAKHADFRARMGWPGVGGTDTYVIREMARSGDRATALRYAFECIRRPRPSPRRMASVGLAALGLQRRPDPTPPPEALAAVKDVRRLVSGGAAGRSGGG